MGKIKLKSQKGDNGKWGYVDEAGNWVIEPKYGGVWDFNEGLALVRNRKWEYGVIDQTGKEVVPCIHDDDITGFFSEEPAKGLLGARLRRFYEEQHTQNHKESESLAPAELKIKKGDNGKYGFIDQTGKEVIPCIYDNVWDFSEGLAVVELDEKYGYIDQTGKEIVPCIYDNAGDFNEGLSFVELDEKYGFIDQTGNVVVPFIYDDAEDFREGLAKVQLNGRYGYIDQTGKEIVPCIYDCASNFIKEGLANVGIAKNWRVQRGIIDKTGKEIVPLIYNDAWFSDGFIWVELRVSYSTTAEYYIDKDGNMVEDDENDEDDDDWDDEDDE